MLTPDQITALRDMSGQIVEPVVDFLIEDIARRISEAGQLTGTAAYQVWQAQKLGLSQRQLKKELRKRLKVSHRQLRQLLTQAAEAGYDFDIKRFPQVQAVSFTENTTLQQILDATVKLAQNDLTNVTQTIGFITPDGKCEELTEAYRKTCDFAFQKVVNGAQDYTSAIRDATRHLAEKGIRTIDYDSGVHTSLEAAVRRNIMGGLGLMNEQITQQNHDDLGCDGWEISAHGGSAPDHEPIQGKQYSDAAYTRLNNSLVRRIGTLNCGHSAMPIIMGVNEPQYTAAELEEFRQQNEAGIDFEGKHYTLYEATQRQRSLERSIRKTKRKILIDESTGDAEKLQWDQIRLVRTREEYHRFSKAAGLPEQFERMEKAGFTWKHGKVAEKVARDAQNHGSEKSQGFGVGSPKTDVAYVKSSEYRNKFGGISDNYALNEAIYKRCKAAVIHQSGDYFEDLSVITQEGKVVGTTSGRVRNETFYTDALKEKIKEYPDYSLVVVHNHGTNTPPSGADLVSAAHKKYQFGVVACNDGKVYLYDVRDVKMFFTPALFDKTVDKHRMPPYNMGEVEAYKAALTQFEKDYGVKWREL